LLEIAFYLLELEHLFFELCDVVVGGL